MNLPDCLPSAPLLAGIQQSRYRIVQSSASCSKHTRAQRGPPVFLSYAWAREWAVYKGGVVAEMVPAMAVRELPRTPDSMFALPHVRQLALWTRSLSYKLSRRLEALTVQS